MQLDAFLADSVVVADGKLYVQGAGWNRIIAGSFPAMHDRIGVGLIFHVDAAMRGSHAFELRLEDGAGHELPLGNAPQGGTVSRIGGEFNVQTSGETESLMPLAINLNGVVFSGEGDYRFVLSVDGADVRDLRFRVEPHAREERPVTVGGGYL